MRKSMIPLWPVTSFSMVSGRPSPGGTGGTKTVRGPLAGFVPVLVTLWLLIPLGVAAYHYGPGQEEMVTDEAGQLLKEAEKQATDGMTAQAIETYKKALEKIPDEKLNEQRRVRLEIAKLQMNSQELPDAYLGLQALVEELNNDSEADPELTEEARAAFANARYYVTWLMRLEGYPEQEWKQEIEATRQTFRDLAETAAKKTAGKTSTKADKEKQEEKVQRYREDLEATIRLERMELSELQGLSLPCQCKGCCTGKCKGKGKCNCKKKGRGPGKKKTKDARGASSGPPPDGSGS